MQTSRRYGESGSACAALRAWNVPSLCESVPLFSPLKFAVAVLRAAPLSQSTHSRMSQPAAAASAVQPPHVTSSPDNLVHSSAPGCHIAGPGSDPSSAWVLSRRRFSRRSLGLRKADAVPDISLEPQSKTLMFLNPSDGAKAFFVSVLHRCTGRHGPLAAGASRDAQGQETPVTTLVVTVQPQQIVEVCTVQVRRPAVHVRLQPRLQPRMPRLPTVAGAPGTRRAALLGHRRATRTPPAG